MSTNQASHRTGDHHGPTLWLYLVVACALGLFTAFSFLVNGQVRIGRVQAHTGFALILSVAFAKAVLVGMFFMHLKYDWGKLYFLIVPVSILAVVLVIALLPDMVIDWE
jgi:cytochrome c oxidase subunit IV